MRKTDWDAYYNKPTGPSAFTRRITIRGLLKLLAIFDPGARAVHICELGGGNSCVYPAIRNRYRNTPYTVIDNNLLGLQLFKERYASDSHINVLERDVLQQALPDLEADVVLSVGLIEHFLPEDTARVICNHFVVGSPNVLVIITFPTPTWLYRVTRALIEALGAWQFPDERPLSLSEVVTEVGRYGDILHTSINWGVILTQGIVVARGRLTGRAAATLLTDRR